MLKQKRCTLFFLAILLLAGFFRFWQLDQVPPGLYPDVAVNGIDALNALKTGDFKVFYPENNGREGFFINLDALSIWLFGPSVFALKFPAVLLGFLTVLGFYFLVKEIFAYLEKEKAEIIALLSTFFLAISFWHVNFSRLGFRAIMVPFCLVWSFWFLFKAINARNQTKSNWLLAFYWLLAGSFFGLGFHTYIAFRIAPIILFPLLITEVIRYWPRFKTLWQEKKSAWEFSKQTYVKDGWWGWDVFIIAAILVILPLGLYYWQNPADFMGRAGQVSIFSSENPIKTLALSTAKTLGQFVVYGDGNQRHNISGSPEIFWPLIPFFLIGLIYSITQIFRPKNYREKKYAKLAAFWTMLTWWGAMLMPSIMTNEGLPHALRSIGAAPVSYIFTGLGLYLIIRLVQEKIQNKKALTALGALIFIFAISLIGLEYWRYFVIWGQNQETRGAFTQKFVDQGNYLNSLPASAKKYVVVNEGGVAVPYPDGFPMPSQTIMYVSHKTANITYLKEDQVDQIQKQGQEGQAIVLPLKNDLNLFTYLKAKFPQGTIEKKNDFSVFIIK